MPVTSFDPISLAVALALIALVPTVVVASTTFLKIAVVMSLLRNALGIQQIPPNLALYGLSLILTVYIMAPVGQEIHRQYLSQPGSMVAAEKMIGAVTKGSEPLREFLIKHSDREQRSFFLRAARQMWGEKMSADLKESDFIIVVPAFMVTELVSAFKIGFLLFLPFVIIDLVISNILLAMGMMMVSPVMISLPLKLFLFVMVDGWTRLIQGLVLSYV
jgi:type III secretion protein R